MVIFVNQLVYIVAVQEKLHQFIVFEREKLNKPYIYIYIYIYDPIVFIYHSNCFYIA